MQSQRVDAAEAKATASLDPPPGVLKDDDPTRRKLGRLGELQCSLKDVALAFGVTEVRLTNFLKKSKATREAFAASRGRGLEAQRRAQCKLAETNAAMAIFLGKNNLGQTDRRELEQSGAIDNAEAAQRVRNKLAALAAEQEAKSDREGE
jgi:hypothetical protein